ncbi:hypothetical protein BGW36DRAFT_464683 [Talaromyces proteolyticus]|uniref:F-box domain-containing protein n=1 Tax=Talaromyces proteolyticus TaxID=1131652 RepID=A0AAD4KIX9_9EURO|nr:uncharacterized protein BGW36DRAFT_464683 [Talaromyces proteolyticus]KAH8692124.1 hypothetical protein BGW36DRAFT_464683 [Talaromyces proteolyticus]
MGERVIHLFRQFFICHPERLDGRAIDQTPESEWAGLLPHSWTYRLWRIARNVNSFDEALKHIRYHVFHLYGRKTCFSLFPGTFILTKACEAIENKETDVTITKKQLLEGGLKINEFGLIELSTGGFDLRGVRPGFVSTTRDTSVCEKLKKEKSLETSGLVDRKTGSALSSSEKCEANPNNALGDNPRENSWQSTTCKDNKEAHLLTDLHLEIIEMIAGNLPTSDRISMSLTNKICRSAVRNLLRRDHLVLASSKGDIARVWALLRDGTSISWNTSEGCLLDHPLLRATSSGHLELVRIFLYELDMKSHETATPEQRHKLEAAAFLVACRDGFAAIVEYFIKQRHIDVNATSDNGTALAIAAAHGKDGIISLLLKAGARATYDDLMSAAQGRFTDVIQVLLYEKNDNLLHPFDVQQLHELVDLLESEVAETKEELRRIVQGSARAKALMESIIS